MAHGFTLNGEWYAYPVKCHAPGTERRVELPIILRILKRYEGQRILELGNVLHRVTRIRRDVVDLHEKGCINTDITCYHPDAPYDLIVSISTLEHIDKPAAHHLHRLLAPDGRITVTWPIGYNHTLDSAAFAGRLPFTLYYMKRVNKSNEWTQTTQMDVEHMKYNHPYPYANAIIIAQSQRGE